MRFLVALGELHARRGRDREAAACFNDALAAFAAAGVRPEYRWSKEAREELSKLAKDKP